MMPKWLRVALALVLGFILGAVAGYFAILLLSSNEHDRGLEAAMTAFFVFGPLGAVAAGGVSFFRR